LASITYDKAAKVFYVQVRRGKVARTEPLNDSVFLDLDRAGRLIGIEVVLPKDLPPKIASTIAAAA
jgi:uncharacterized protein YuzE